MPVTSRAIRMGGFEPAQDPGPVQKVMHQCVNGNQLHANFKPSRTNVGGPDYIAQGFITALGGSGLVSSNG